MLLRLLKSNTLFSFLLIPVIGVLFWMNSFQSAVSLDLKQANGAMPLYYLVFDLLKNSGFWQVFVSFCLVIVNSFFVAQLSSSFIFLRKRSYLTGIIYLITVSSLQFLHAFLPVHLATLCVLMSIYFIFDTYHKPIEITFTFNASFFLALASLFYFPSVILFPLVWIAIFVLQKSDNWRLLVVPLLGFGLPWLFIWAYTFLSGSSSAMWKDLIGMLFTSHNAYLLEPLFLLITGVVTVTTTLGSLSVIAVYHRMKVSARKYFVILYWMLGLVVASALGLITIGIDIVALSTIPVAFFISHFLLSDKRLIWREIVTWVYLVTMVFVLCFYKSGNL